jgi:hypothetical protein
MKELSFDEMVKVQAGEELPSCGMAITSLVLDIVGTGLSFASLNPLGVVMGVFGLYLSGAGMVKDCGLI